MKEKASIYRIQDLVLRELNVLKSFPFVLSGGTALSRFYFHHRFSEDLDFFFEGYDFAFEKVSQVISYLRKVGFHCDVIGRSDQEGYLKVDSYAVTKSSIKSVLKVDFLEDPFSGMWPIQKKKTESGVSFRIDHLDQIYYRKFYSVLVQLKKGSSIQRTKDLLDLYELHNRHRSIEVTVEMYIKEHVPIDEERLILAFSNLKKSEVKLGLKELGVDVDAEALCCVFKNSAEKLMKKGLRV